MNTYFNLGTPVNRLLYLKSGFIRFLRTFDLKKMDMQPQKEIWESGYWWRVGKTNANALIGGHIYLHSAQTAPSHQDGKITGYRIQHGGQFDGRYIFGFFPLISISVSSLMVLGHFVTSRWFCNLLS
ncbi:MAG: hypothetical protein M0P74_10595 [Syntrophales bacterium]|jgi:hypothetical protein|nr:hypothetical protein [Syntrophales bacterium]